MDGGSGFEFTLPHLSPADREGPNKAVDGLATVPMKVMNGLVHGDKRSHVILSPGVVGATANHTCESLTIMINTVFKEHETMPPEGTLQFDGATTNKCILTLAYSGLYVLEKVFTRFHAKNELENHAHDLYDAFHAVHAVGVRRSTFFHLEELRSIIRASHEVSKDAAELRPIAGHDVLVSNLWEARDFWEWLCPRYTAEKTRPHALANAAFTSYTNLARFRDFKMELEEGSTDANPRVGLWAKTYMTSPEYQYLGTLLTRQSFQAVTRGREPPMQRREVSDQKSKRETTVAKKLVALSQGPYGQQFTAARLEDAVAICQRRWDHFKDSEGALPPELMMLPHQLAGKTQGCGIAPEPRSSLVCAVLAVHVV